MVAEVFRHWKGQAFDALLPWFAVKCTVTVTRSAWANLFYSSDVKSKTRFSAP